jgi:hypothetical protein
MKDVLKSHSFCAIIEALGNKSKPRETWRRKVMGLRHVQVCEKIARLPKIAKPSKDGDAKPGV